jgi:hypothetical protein
MIFFCCKNYLNTISDIAKFQITLTLLRDRVDFIAVELEGSGSDATSWLGR